MKMIFLTQLGDIMDSDNLYFDLMREREHSKQVLRSQQLDSQEVPSLIWNYSVKNSIPVAEDDGMKELLSDDEDDQMNHHTFKDEEVAEDSTKLDIEKGIIFCLVLNFR